jgi:hypothetical protein
VSRVPAAAGAHELRPARKTHLFVLDEQGVFYADADQELHVFNTPATFVWCCLEEGMDRRAIRTLYADRFGLEPGEASREVAGLLRRFERRGWIEGPGAQREARGRRRAPRRRRPRSVRGPREPRDPARHDLDPGLLRRSYQLLDTRFEVRFPGAAEESRAHPAMAHLEGGAPGPADVLLEIEPEGAGHVLRENGVPVEACDALEGLTPMLKAALWRIAVNRHSFFMEIHAGAVYDGHACIVLPGAPGSGKTTFTAALAASGFGYLSDEVVLLEEGSLELRPVPLALTVKRGSLDLLADLYPGLREHPAHQRQDGRVVRYVPPPRASRLPDAPLPVGAVVFPRVADETALRPLGRVEALQRMLDECLVVPARLSEGKVRRLVRWMRGLRCYEMSLASLPEAIALLEGLSSADGLASPDRSASTRRQIGNAA